MPKASFSLMRGGFIQNGCASVSRLIFGLAVLALLGNMMSSWASAEVIVSDPSFPPEKSEYRARFHSQYTSDFLLTNIRYSNFTDVQREEEGEDEVETFRCQLHATGIFQGQEMSIVLTGHMKIRVFGKVGQTAGSWEAEIEELPLRGSGDFGEIEIRLDPESPSTGVTSVDPLENVRYVIDSFFDVYAEVSIPGVTDGFVPDLNAPSRVELSDSAPSNVRSRGKLATTWGKIKHSR